MHFSRSPLHSRLSHTAALALLVSGLTSCNETFRIPGTTPAVAESRVAQLFQSIADRYSDILLSPRYDAARLRLAQAALTPSRVFDDTMVWDGAARAATATRVLYVSGETAGGRYHLDTRPSLAPPPARPGDTRHSIGLELVAPSVYRWDTNVDLAIGTITAQEVSETLTALFRSAAGRDERELRENYRAAFPRGAAAFGRGFSVDSLHVTPGAPGSGTTSVAITVGFHPESMRAAFPALTNYLDKYLGPAKYHFALADRSGVALLDIVGRDRAITLRYRMQNGVLVSLAGEPRPWPDSLELTSDLSLKIKHFTVGFHNLVTAFVIDNTGHDRAWTLTSRREPEWDLPLATVHLIRTPLRRPFLGEGAVFRISVHDSAGMQTIVGRHTRLDVQESTIVRFLGSLTAHALGDLDAQVEVEEDRFFREGFASLRADLAPLAARWADASGPDSPRN